MKRLADAAKVDDSEPEAVTTTRGRPSKRKASALDDELLTETSEASPWYVTKKDRKYYKMKSLDKSSFVFTRVRPKRGSNQ